MTDADPDRERIVDAALALAATRPWEAVRLHAVAAALGLTLDDLRRHFREKEDLVDAWFDRADAAMLRDAATAEFLALPGRARLHRGVMTWLGALAPHRRATRQMLLGKLEPGHLHVQIPALLRVSRTVQWLREAAGRDAVYLHRAVEETALTTIFLLAVLRWLNDDTPDFMATRRLLDRLLDAAGGVEGGMRRLLRLMPFAARRGVG